MSTQALEYEYEVTPGISRDTLKRSGKPLEPWDSVDLSTPEKMLVWANNRPRYPLRENHLTDLALNNVLSKSNFKILSSIGQNVLYYNLSYVRLTTLKTVTNLSQSMISKGIATLIKEDLIKVLHNNTFGVGTRVFMVNPAFFWKGHPNTQFKFRMKWMKSNIVLKVD